MRIFVIFLTFLSLSCASDIFKKECSVCHGKKGNKRPMGKNTILVKFDEKKLIEKITAFKEGKNKKALMAKNHERLLRPLGDKEIELLANYIKGLK